MQSINRQRIGGQFLAIGAAIAMLMQIYWLLQPDEYISFPYKIISFVFGNWLASLIMPFTIEETIIAFSPSSLLFVPWAAVIILFLLWSAIKILQGQFNRVSYSALVVLGYWLFVAIIDEKVLYGSFLFQGGLKWVLPRCLRDLSGVAMVIGIGVVLLERNKQNSEKKMTLSQVLFSFKGRICRSEYWCKAFPILFAYGIIVNLILIIEIESSRQLWISLLLPLPGWWPYLAVAVKRLHDRNRSGWLLLTLLIPILNIIFAIWLLFIEMWFLKGTEGENRFGPDPLQIAGK